VDSVDPAARRAELIQQLKRAGWAWSIFVCIVGTIGGVISIIEMENDRT
jgi:hypothetical protein